MKKIEFIGTWVYHITQVVFYPAIALFFILLIHSYYYNNVVDGGFGSYGEIYALFFVLPFILVVRVIGVFLGKRITTSNKEKSLYKIFVPLVFLVNTVIGYILLSKVCVPDPLYPDYCYLTDSDGEGFVFIAILTALSITYPTISQKLIKASDYKFTVVKIVTISMLVSAVLWYFLWYLTDAGDLFWNLLSFLGFTVY